MSTTNMPTAAVEVSADKDSVPYAVSELDGVRVLLYRNPENGEHVSVQIETDQPTSLRIMLNDADLHDGPVE